MRRRARSARRWQRCNRASTPYRRSALGGHLVIAVLHPFRHVAVHVMEPERIRREPADRRRLAAVPLASAIGAIGFALPGVVSPPVARVGTCARGVFPFGLGQQAIAIARAARHPGDVLLRIRPADIDHGLPAATPARVVRTAAAAAGRHAGVPLRKGHLKAPDRQHVADGHGKRAPADAQPW